MEQPPITPPRRLLRVTSAQAGALVGDRAADWHAHDDLWLAAARAGTRATNLFLAAGDLPPAKCKHKPVQRVNEALRRTVNSPHEQCDNQSVLIDSTLPRSSSWLAPRVLRVSSDFGWLSPPLTMRPFQPSASHRSYSHFIYSS